MALLPSTIINAFLWTLKAVRTFFQTIWFKSKYVREKYQQEPGAWILVVSSKVFLEQGVPGQHVQKVCMGETHNLSSHKDIVCPLVDSCSQMTGGAGSPELDHRRLRCWLIGEQTHKSGSLISGLGTLVQKRGGEVSQRHHQGLSLVFSEIWALFPNLCSLTK
jgi:hypothetical protein